MTDVEEEARRRADAAAGTSDERQVSLSRRERDELAEVVKQMRKESRRVFGSAVARVVDRWDGPDVVRSALEWARLEGIHIRDPDGWREDGKSLDDPINEAEYRRRVNISTIGPA